MLARSLINLAAVVLTASTLFAPVSAHAGFWSWLFGPKDYEECAENAAREAKSKEALTILLNSCDSKFPGRRKPAGGYTFYDSRQNRTFDIAGPNPSPKEFSYIETEYAKFLSEKTERDRQFHEWLRNEEIEAQRRAAIGQEEAKRQAEIRQQDAQRQAALAQIAQAELSKRRQAALQRVVVISSNIECKLSLSCDLYRLTVRIGNQSGEAISTISLGWVFMRRDDHLNCPTSVATKRQFQVQLVPNDTTVFNIDADDGPTSDQFRYCVRVTGVEIAPQSGTGLPNAGYDANRSGSRAKEGNPLVPASGSFDSARE